MLNTVLAAGVVVYSGVKIISISSKRLPFTRLNRGGERVLVKALLSPSTTTQTALQAVSNRSRMRLGNIRNQQFQILSSSAQAVEVSKAERSANQKLAISVASIGLIAAANWFYQPLLLAGLVGISFIVIPRFRGAYKAIKECRLRIEIVDSLWIIGGLLSGYYFWVALGCGIYYLGEKFLAKTEDNSRRSLVNIFGGQPEVVWVVVGDNEVEIETDKVQKGDMLVISAGQVIPVDGTIVEGVASIDQHQLTGEAQPAEKVVGDSVLASTMVLSGKLYIRAEKTGQETSAAQIGQILNQSANFKLSIQSKGELLTNKAALPTLLLSSIAMPLVGPNGALALLGNYPGANLRLLAPMTLLNFLHIASKNGILVKDGRSLELLEKIDTVVFDKTGTLTLEQPHVYQIHTSNDYSEDELLTYAATAEHRQTHPIALAILDEAQRRGLTFQDIQDAQYEIGYGIKVKIGGTTANESEQQLISLGSDRFMLMEGILLPAEIDRLKENCHTQGRSLVMIAINGQFVGAIELKPTIRPEAQSIIDQLMQRNFELYIISGDQEEPTQILANKLGIEHYFANTLPENKAQLIEQLQEAGRTVCFVGDGINDSLALNAADVSISLSGASTIAIDTAQIVLMDASLNRLIDLLDIIHKLNTNMNTNIITSALPGLIGIGGVFFLHYGFLSSIILYNLGLFGGIANTLLPMFQPTTSTGENA